MHPWPSLQAGSEGEAGPSRRASQRPRRRRRAELEGDSDAEQEAEAAAEGRQRKRPRHGAGWRELANYAWLAVCEQTPGVYVPQVGVVGLIIAALCSSVQCWAFKAVPSCWCWCCSWMEKQVYRASPPAISPHESPTAASCLLHICQAGDDVVYLRQGHQRFLEATGDKRQPPWAQLRHGRRLRHAEPCRQAGGCL